MTTSVQKSSKHPSIFDMHFFSKSDPEPEVPVPSSSIALDHEPGTVFRPGQLISGRVIFENTVNTTPSAVELTLWGQSETYIRRSESHSSGTGNNQTSSTTYRHYRDHAPLFIHTLNLFPSPYPLLPNTKYQWPFQVQFPERTNFSRAACYEDPWNEIWTSVPHLLPPTFIHEPEGVLPHRCSITYGVTATIKPPAGHPDEIPWSVTAPLNFLPNDRIPQAMPPPAARSSAKTFDLASSMLAGVAQPGFRQKLADRFSSETPKVTFELGCSMPAAVSCGDVFSVRGAVRIVERSANVSVLPPVAFRVKKLELLDFALFRAPRDWAARDTSRGEPSKYHTAEARRLGYHTQEMEISEQSVVLNAMPEHQNVSFAEGKGGGSGDGVVEASFTGRIPGYATPSFQGFAITLAYRLKAKVEVEWCGKRFELKFEVPDVLMRCPPVAEGHGNEPKLRIEDRG